MQKPFDVTQFLDDGVEKEVIRQYGGTKFEGIAQVEELTTERQDTHGDFRTNARLSQEIKAVLRSYEGWDHLDDVEKEVMDMIALKFSRVLSGRSLEKQHWEDIEGYAHLALRECK